MFYINGERSIDNALQNNAFVNGDAVKVYFFVKNSGLIMAEECYFFLMASMRKMRMNIPLSFTLEYFTELFSKAVVENNFSEGTIEFLAFRNREAEISPKTPIQFCFELISNGSILDMKGNMELDVIKEIHVNNNILSSIHTHCPENIYASIYAAENDLDEVILLNPEKRIARTISGNILLLEGNIIKVPKQSEGAFISPLMENFVTFLFKNNIAQVEESEISAFESQKAEEILVISDSKGIFSVSKIRNKTFDDTRFSEMLASWQNSFI